MPGVEVKAAVSMIATISAPSTWVVSMRRPRLTDSLPHPLTRVLTLLLVVGLSSTAPGLASAARAQAAEADEVNDEVNDEVAWRPRWPRARTWQYVAAPALIATGLSFRFLGPQQINTWRGELIPGEHDLTHLVSMETTSARDNAQLVSEISFYGSMGYRFFDSVVMPGLYHENWDLALQMALIDMQAFGLVGTVLWGTQIFVARERPAVSHCAEDDPRPSAMCGPDNSERYRSFIAGHAATATAAAGLTCLHHARIPLYGGGLADDLACASMIGVAGVASATRLMVEYHYPSDVVMGVGLGLVAGWVMPSVLHYGFGDDSEVATSSLEAQEDQGWRPGEVLLQVGPALDAEGGGLQVNGFF